MASSFTGGDDGAYPQAGLVLSGRTLYGTAYDGGSSYYGTVFAVNTDSTGFTNLYSFTGGSDGGNPTTGLVLSDDILYGKISGVFAVNTNGTGFTNLYSLTSGNGGGIPGAGLILSGNTLYGTTYFGGGADDGTVFAINTDGTGFTNIYGFTGYDYDQTNGDGAFPQAGLILSGNTLYGTTTFAGGGGNGTVFRVNTDGTDFTNLHNFATAAYGLLATYTNCDGASPQASLILLGNTLYGTAPEGGNSGYGTAFAVNTDGTGFTILHSLPAAATELIRRPDWFYAATPCMGRRVIIYRGRMKKTAKEQYSQFRSLRN